MNPFAARLRRLAYRRRLRDPAYRYLFEPPPDADLVCLDTETTGLDPKTSEILSIGAVKIRGDRVLMSQRLGLTLRPRGPVPAETIPIHQLRDRDVSEGLEPRRALAELLDFIGSRPLVGYYLAFDIRMIDRLLDPWLRIRLPNPRIEVSGVYHDQKIARIPQGFIDLRFATLLADLEIPDLGQHDAFNDALMTALMYIKLQHRPRLAKR
jgi:DNA polymerase-3 subunit epsilon